eukprot:564006-Amphidinium_carterae.1
MAQCFKRLAAVSDAFRAPNQKADKVSKGDVGAFAHPNCLYYDVNACIKTRQRRRQPTYELDQ